MNVDAEGVACSMRLALRKNCEWQDTEFKNPDVAEVGCGVR